MDLIEVIAPIIFVLIFGLGKVFEKLQEQGSKGSQKPRQTVDGEESSGWSKHMGGRTSSHRGANCH